MISTSIYYTNQHSCCWGNQGNNEYRMLAILLSKSVGGRTKNYFGAKLFSYIENNKMLRVA